MNNDHVIRAPENDTCTWKWHVLMHVSVSLIFHCYSVRQNSLRRNVHHHSEYYSWNKLSELVRRWILPIQFFEQNIFYILQYSCLRESIQNSIYHRCISGNRIHYGNESAEHIDLSMWIDKSISRRITRR